MERVRRERRWGKGEGEVRVDAREGVSESGCDDVRRRESEGTREGGRDRGKEEEGRKDGKERESEEGREGAK